MRALSGVLAAAMLLAGCGAVERARPRRAAPPTRQLAVPDGHLAAARLAPLGDGAALVAVSVDRPTPNGYSCRKPTRERGVLARFAHGRFVSRELIDASIDELAAGGGRVALVSTRPVRANGECVEVARLTLETGTAQRPRAATVVLARSARVVATALAVDGQGTVALAWVEEVRRRGAPYQRLWLTTWRRGGQPSTRRLTPDRLAADFGGGDAFAGLRLHRRPGGGWLVASRQSGRANVIVLDEIDAGGHRTSWRLGRADFLADVTLGVSPRGRIVVVWGSQDGGEERNEPYVVRATAREVGARRFTTAQVLDVGGSAGLEPPGRPRVVVTPGGAATAVWANRDQDGTGRIMEGRAAPGEPFGPPRTVAARRGLEAFSGAALILRDGALLSAHRGPSRPSVRLSRPHTETAVAALVGRLALLIVERRGKVTARLLRL